MYIIPEADKRWELYHDPDHTMIPFRLIFTHVLLRLFNQSKGVPLVHSYLPQKKATPGGIKSSARSSVHLRVCRLVDGAFTSSFASHSPIQIRRKKRCVTRSQPTARLHTLP